MRLPENVQQSCLLSRDCRLPLHDLAAKVGSSGLALTARTWALQNCMSLIPKPKQALREWGMMNLMTQSKLFIFNILAERVGFEPSVSNKINKLGGANGTSNL
jgi:hypothetical protein